MSAHLGFVFVVPITEAQAKEATRAIRFLRENAHWEAASQETVDGISIGEVFPNASTDQRLLKSEDSATVLFAYRIFQDVVKECDDVTAKIGHGHNHVFDGAPNLGWDNTYEATRDGLELSVETSDLGDPGYGALDVAVGVAKAVQSHFDAESIGFTWHEWGYSGEAAGGVFIPRDGRPKYMTPEGWVLGKLNPHQTDERSAKRKRASWLSP